jgi:hypothetical protein
MGYASEAPAMPLLKYVLTVSTALTLGLFALNAYLDPNSSDAAAKVSVAPTTATLLHFGPPLGPVARKPKESK